MHTDHGVGVMDRVISLLAALVGLIALGGAILVHVNGDAQRGQMAAEIAQLKLSVGLLNPQSPASVATADPVHIPSAEPASSSALVLSQKPSQSAEPVPAVASSQQDDEGLALKALQDRIGALEQASAEQASELEEARAKLAPQPPAQAEISVAAASVPESTTPTPGTTPAVVVADGPTKDCIPLGTRFMGTTGDAFPICKTKIVLRVAAVSDGLATITGAGDVAVGASVPLDKSCMISVFSADTSGYAEMRVTCQ
jgi:hypothetical protein